LLTTTPASAMSYDGRALTARPLDVETTASRVVLTTRAHGSLTLVAAAFRTVCFDLFASQKAAHPESRFSPDLEQSL
jgi:hypothetical protein